MGVANNTVAPLQTVNITSERHHVRVSLFAGLKNSEHAHLHMRTATSGVSLKTCLHMTTINYIESFKENTNEKQMKDGPCGHELIARQLCLVLRAQMQGSEATHTLAYNDSTHSKTLSVGSLLLVV